MSSNSQLLDYLRSGSEFLLHSASSSNPSSFTTARIFLFLRDEQTQNSPVSLGRCGALFWSLNGLSDPDSSSNRLFLHTLTEIKLGKNCPIFRLDSAKKINENLCFSLSATNIELNLQAFNVETRDIWWNAILAKLESPSLPPSSHSNSLSGAFSAMSMGGQHVNHDNPGDEDGDGGENDPNPSSNELIHVMQRGTRFMKYDSESSGKVYSCPILLFAEGSGRSGSICWVEINNPNPRPSAAPFDNKISVDRITDFLLKKKSPPLKLSKSPDECCFALVTDRYTLNLEATSKESCKQWKEGLIMMLTTTGKEVIRAEGNSSAAPAASQSAIPPAPAPPRERDEKSDFLRDGQVFTLYYANAKGQQEVAKVLIFFVDMAGNDAPGALYWCAAASGMKRQLEGQRLMLNTLKQMIAGKEQSSFKIAAAAVPVAADNCFSIVGKSLVLNLEAPSHAARDQWMKGLHNIMMKYQSEVQARKKASQAASAAAAAAVIASSPDLPAPPPPVPSPSASAIDEPIRVLKEGQQFLMYLQSASGETHTLPVFVFLQEGDGPGSLCWCEPGRRDVIPSQRLMLQTISRMVAGKETAPFQSPVASKVPIDRCLSLIGKTMTVNLEAPNFEVRETWMKNLHQIMLRLGKKAHPAQVAQPAAQPALQDPEAQYLMNGQVFKLYNLNPSTQAVTLSDILIFFEPLTGAEFPGALLWQPANQPGRARIEGQKLLLNKIQQMAGGKDTPALKSQAAAAAPRDRCFFLMSSTISLSLEAGSADVKNTWMKNLHQLMIKLGRQTIDENKGKAKPQNGKAAAEPAKALPTIDSKKAVAILLNGQNFTLYGVNEKGQEFAKQFFFYCVPDTSSELPALLFWCEPGQRIQLPKQKLNLGGIKQMRAGKDAPLLKTPLAAKAKPNCCLAILTNSVSIAIEAPSTEIRDDWMKAIHAVLVRHGMKAVEGNEDQANASPQPADAVPPAPAPPVSDAPGSARPLPNAGAGAGAGAEPWSNDINRTINFMDPTEFFCIQAKIGEGSYGAVYKAIDYRDGKSVAIKVIPFSGKDSLKLRKEIRVLKQCNCPFIVGYRGAFHKNDTVWIVMEYCGGGSLSDIMQICKRTLSEQQVASVMRMCLAGLAYLHGQGIIHRDIKGGNIVADAAGVCKLADFGVSANLDKTLGKHRTVIGSPHWMAPEVLMSDDYNELADVWSLGITAYELAIGEPPHAKLHSMRAALKIPMSPPPTLPDPGHWSADFHSFIAACLVKDFNVRPSAAQLLTHPFITKAPSHHILQDIISRSVQYFESRAQHDITNADVIRQQNPMVQRKAAGAEDEEEEGKRMAATG